MGYGAVVRAEEVIGLFDLDGVSASRRTQTFLLQAEEDGELLDLSRGLPVSLVVTDFGCYLSPVSSATLGRRLAEDRLE